MDEDRELGAEPDREEIDGSTGPLLLEFGAAWCGYCRALAPRLAKMLRSYPEIRHVKIEDGPGRRLGRSFRVKLWPTLVFLRDGAVVGQVSRPDDEEVKRGLEDIAGRDVGAAEDG